MYSETEESEAARAARMEIVSALKSRKAAMEEKLKAKIEELKKICIEEGALSGQLPPEYPLSPGEALPTIRRRVGTSFTLPENLLNKAKSSKVRMQSFCILSFLSLGNYDGQFLKSKKEKAIWIAL